MVKLTLKSVLATSALAACAISSASVTYRLTALAPAPGYTQSVAMGLNDLGQVVGYSAPNTIDFNYQGTIWKNGQPTLLGKVDRGNYSLASSINKAGEITGEGDNGNIRPQVIIFAKGKASIIDSGANNSRGMFISKTGVIAGNYARGFGGGGWNPVLYTPDPRKPGEYKRTSLPQFPDPSGAQSYCYCFGGNNRGEVIGQISSSLWSARGGLWNADATHSLTLLDPLPNEWDSYAMGINDGGTVVGYSDTGVFSSTPVIWSASTHEVAPLPLFPEEIHGYAWAINGAGTIIGAHGENGQACVWVNGQIQDLQASLDSTGAGWTIEFASGINKLGQIVGYGQFNGKTTAFVLSPISTGP